MRSRRESAAGCSLGLWFALACAPRNTQLSFGGDRLAATRGDAGFTVRVPLALIESARTVPLHLRDADTGEELAVATSSSTPESAMTNRNTVRRNRRIRLPDGSRP